MIAHRSKKRYLARSVKLLCVLLLILLERVEGEESYDFFQTNVVGSPRRIALGGATRAVPMGVASSLDNPALLSFMPSRWDFEFYFGSFKQERGTIQNLEIAARQDLYFGMGTAFRIPSWRNLGFGLFIYSHYAESFEGLTLSNQAEEDIVSYKQDQLSLLLPMSIQVDETWSLGTNLRIDFLSSEFSTELFRNQLFAEQKFRAEFAQWNADFGFYKELSSRWAISLVHHLGVKLKPERENEESVELNEAYRVFRPARLPHRSVLGTRWRRQNLQLSFDLEHHHPQSGSILSGSGISEFSSSRRSGHRRQWQWHLGAEWELLRDQLFLRAGHYFQPGRAEGENSKWHLTGGFDWAFWLVKLSAAGDIAKDYYLWTFSVGPNWRYWSKSK